MRLESSDCESFEGLEGGCGDDEGGVVGVGVHFGVGYSV